MTVEELIKELEGYERYTVVKYKLIIRQDDMGLKFSHKETKEVTS